MGRQDRKTTTLHLPGGSAGTTRTLVVHRWRGAEAAPKAYLQAAIHADEVPALLVADHLTRQLDALAEAGRIRGEIVLVPYANPLGMAQFVGGSHLGRFDLDSGRNFNRGYPRVIDAVAQRVERRLGMDPSANVRAVRAALRRVLSEPGPQDENGALKWALFRLAADADIVLDLHCDFEALMHLYVGAAHWPQARDLAAALGARVVLIAGDSGGDSFDEACARVFVQLAERFPDRPIPPACLAATIELRGDRDVDDGLADSDAANLVAFLAGRGVLDAPATVIPPRVRATALEAVDIVTAPCSGVLVWRERLGARVDADTVLGEIVVPGTGERHPVITRTAGLLFARRGHRLVRGGQMLAKVAGAAPLPWRRPGALLFD